MPNRSESERTKQMSRILSELEQEQSKPKKSKAPSKPKQAEEHRTKRVQIVMTPTLFEELTETRWKNKTKSLNETIIQAIEQYIERSK